MQPSIANQIIEVRHLDKNAGTDFQLTFDDQRLVSLAKALDVVGLKKVKFSGQLRPAGKGDWALTADLGATVTQTCVVSFEPVTTRLDFSPQRIFRRKLTPLDDSGPETEMPNDVSEEQLGEAIDLLEVFAECLSLEIPDYPRADDVETFRGDYAAPGVDPLNDETIKPFAGLATLKDKLS